MGNFCEKCGTPLVDNVCPGCMQAEGEAGRQDRKFNKIFMSPDEKLVTVLGNNYIENFLHDGSVRNGFVVVSDKRAYFQGNSYYLNRDAKGRTRVVKNKQSRTVDLKDVTGTGTDTYVDKTWLVMGWIFLVLPFLLMMLGGVLR